MFLVEQFKKLHGMSRYDTATSFTCNLDVLAHFVVSSKMPDGASKSEEAETMELMSKLSVGEVVFIYDRVTFAEYYIKLIDDGYDMVVVRYAVAPGWNSWRVKATNDFVDRLDIRNKVVVDKELIATILDLPGEEKKKETEDAKVDHTTSNLTFDWSTPAVSPSHPMRRATDVIQEATSNPPQPTQTVETTTDTQRPLGGNQMTNAFRSAQRAEFRSVRNRTNAPTSA